jgi:hypothetical protein
VAPSDLRRPRPRRPPSPPPDRARQCSRCNQPAQRPIREAAALRGRSASAVRAVRSPWRVGTSRAGPADTRRGSAARLRRSPTTTAGRCHTGELVWLNQKNPNPPSGAACLALLSIVPSAYRDRTLICRRSHRHPPASRSLPCHRSAQARMRSSAQRARESRLRSCLSRRAAVLCYRAALADGKRPGPASQARRLLTVLGLACDSADRGPSRGRGPSPRARASVRCDSFGAQ